MKKNIKNPFYTEVQVIKDDKIPVRKEYLESLRRSADKINKILENEYKKNGVSMLLNSEICLLLGKISASKWIEKYYENTEDK